MLVERMTRGASLVDQGKTFVVVVPHSSATGNGAKLPLKMIFPAAVDLTKPSLKIPNFYNRSNIIENQPKNNFDYL